MSHSPISDQQLTQLIEASIFVAGKPVTLDMLKSSVLAEFNVSKKRIKHCLDEITLHYSNRGICLVNVASGYRFESHASLAPWLAKLWPDKAPKYSRALLETLSLIAYRQPITRGEIEQVRGVTVSSQIMKQLQDRQWIDIVGHKEVPGRPALYATTKQFLDYFSLAGLEQLPPLPQLQESKIDQLLRDPSVSELSK
jgi:segregation and condensation protein B